MLGLLAGPLGLVMRVINDMVGNYGITLILFTILVRLVMFPLSLKQQQSTVRMAAFQPLIKEIQKKWANDPKRANEEIMQFQEENNLKMTAGCLPMVVNMVVLFSVIAVIQAPMLYMLNIPQESINNGIAIYNVYNEGDDLNPTAYKSQSILIGAVNDHPEWFKEGAEITTTVDGNEETQHVSFSEETIETVQKFEFNFLGLNLSVSPAMEFNRYLIMPILSILTMFLSQLIVMRTSGQQAQTNMLVMTLVSGLMFGWFAFTVPVGFSLYYTISNVLQIGQQFVLRKIYNPEKIKEQIMQDIEERKKEKKAKKKVTVKDEKGNMVTKEMSEAEIARVRLAKARELDAERYKEESAKEKPKDESEKEE